MWKESPEKAALPVVAAVTFSSSGNVLSQGMSVPEAAEIMSDLQGTELCIGINSPRPQAEKGVTNVFCAGGSVASLVETLEGVEKARAQNDGKPADTVSFWFEAQKGTWAGTRVDAQKIKDFGAALAAEGINPQSVGIYFDNRPRFTITMDSQTSRPGVMLSTAILDETPAEKAIPVIRASIEQARRIYRENQKKDQGISV